LADKGSLTITPEWAENVISVEGIGVWSEDQAVEHFRHLRALVVSQRARTGRARVLVDLRQMHGQSDDVAAIVRAETAKIYTIDDRVALLVANAVQRAQMSGLTHTLGGEMFDDVFAALRWLNGDGPAKDVGSA
jgi:hypothetical protein